MIRSKGLTIPNDISVAGYDGQRIARPLRETRLLSPGGAGKVGVLQSELLTARETTLAFIIAIVNIKISIRL